MKLAFIHPPLRHHRFSENLKVVDEEFTCSPPIILAYMAAIAEKNGHQAILIDTYALTLDMEAVKNMLVEFKPDILCFRLDTYTFQDAISWIRYLKNEFNIPVIAGGLNMSLYPNETMSYHEIDFAIQGEAIISFPKLLSAIENKGSFSDIPGLYYRIDGRLVINEKIKSLVDFNSYPFPARHLLPNDKYNSFVSKRKNFTVLLTSTGCPYKCNFCAIAGLNHLGVNHYRERSAENVLAEIEECYHKYGIREIDFFDACFFINKKRTSDLLRGIIKKKLDIIWTCRSRVDLADEKMLRLAYASGLRMVFWGIESGSNEVLNGINKGIQLTQTEKAIKLAHKLRIKSLGFLMLGNPGETRKDIRNTVALAKKLKLDYVQICRTIPKPGTELYRKLVETTNYDYWRELVLGKTVEKRIYVPDRKLSPQQIEKMLKWAYYSFYYRPIYIWRTLINTRSPFELLRYVRVALRMIFHYFYTDVKVAKDSRLFYVLSHKGKLTKK